MKRCIVFLAILVAIIGLSASAFAGRVTISDCAGDCGEWDPSDPRQPAAGTVSPTSNEAIFKGIEIGVKSHLKNPGAQLWYSASNSTPKFAIFFPSQQEKLAWMAGVRSGNLRHVCPDQLREAALRCELKPASIGYQRWLVFHVSATN